MICSKKSVEDKKSEKCDKSERLKEKLIEGEQKEEVKEVEKENIEVIEI